MSATSIIIAVFAAYLALLLGVAAWSSREGETVEGYFIAGKKLPFWVAAFSTNATGESGWLLLGLTGMGYAVGLHALWVTLGEALGLGLSWAVVARRFKPETDRLGSITVPDYLESRFADTRHILRIISVVIILAMVTTYVAAQLVATGKAFSEFMPVSYAWGVVIGAVVTFVYTAVGGFKAVAYTDVIQGVLMLLALIVLPFFAVHAAGGWSAMFQNAGQIDPDLLHWMGHNGVSLAGIIAAVSFVAIGLPFLGVPQLLVRYIAINSEHEVKKAAGISVLCIICFNLGAIFTGMAGRVLFPDLPDPELVLPTLGRELLNPVLTGLLVVVILSAIMSTVDSLFILASSAFSRDLVQKIVMPGLSDHQVARLGKWMTVILGLLGTAIALGESRVIFWFVLFSWSGLGATFGPVVVCSLYWRGTTLWGAAAGMLTGFLTTVLWLLYAKRHVFDLYETVPAFLFSLLMIIVVSKLTARDTSLAAG